MVLPAVSGDCQSDPLCSYQANPIQSACVVDILISGRRTQDQKVIFFFTHDLTPVLVFERMYVRIGCDKCGDLILNIL